MERTAAAVAQKVKAGIITSSPGSIPTPATHRCKRSGATIDWDTIPNAHVFCPFLRKPFGLDALLFGDFFRRRGLQRWLLCQMRVTCGQG